MPSYKWDALALGFVITFLPCLFLTLAYALGSVSWRLRFLLPCPFSKAELVRVTRDIGNDGTQMSADESALNRAIHKWISWVLGALGADRNKVTEIVQVQHTQDGKSFIILRGAKYTFAEDIGEFTAMQAVPQRKVGELRRRIENGLDEGEVKDRMTVFGPNKIDVAVPTLSGAILQEVSGYGYMYQLFFTYQWYFLGSWKVASIWVAVFVSSAVMKAWIMRKNRLILRESSESGNRGFKVMRGGKEVTVGSQDLLPGDIALFQESGVVVPTDCFLLEGSLLIDESVVTGEATPVQKFRLPDDQNKVVRARQDKKNYLFAGTSILQTDCCCKAVVVDTGVNTSRGQLLNASLYPNPLWIKFDEDYKILFVYSFIFGIIAGAVIMHMMGWGVESLFQGGFAIWNTFSPLLPVALVMGQSRAASRLREAHGILCLTPARTAVAGRVDIAVFDKTGTLTEDGLDMVGVILQGGADHQAGDPLFNPSDWSQLGTNPRAHGMRLVMGMAHNVAAHGSDLAGSQVEITMLQKSGGQPDSTSGQINTMSWPDGMRVETVEKFPFNHHTMTMSVVVKCQNPVAISEPTKEGRRFALVKGAPEKVAELCQQSGNAQDPEAGQGSTGGKHFEMQRLLEANNTLSRQGCYVLMAAFKQLPDDSSETLSRDSVESKGSLQPLGLLVFRNALRKESPGLITELKSGSIPSVMASGDSHLTAAAIAREVGILTYSKVLIADVESYKIKWRDMDTNAPGDPMVDDAELVLSGDAWACTRDDTPWLSKAKVFGRISPEQKVEIVEAFIRLGHIAMFVGDGGNDSGALRAAHVGVALTEQKQGSGGSVIAHFNTTEKTPCAVARVLKEGRCALASSLAAFRFLFGYGVQITVMKGLMFGTSHNFHWTGQSLIVLEGLFLPMVVPAMVDSSPRHDLDQKRPSWSLLNTEGCLGMFGPLLLNVMFIGCSFLYMTSQEWYTPWSRKEAGANAHTYISWGDNFEMENIFLVWFGVLAAQSVSFSLGGRFRAPVWSNYSLIAIVIAVYIVVLSLTWTQKNIWSCGMRINCNQQALDSINQGNADFLTWVEMYPGEATHWMSSIPEGNVMPIAFQLVVTGLVLGALVIYSGFQKFIVEAVQANDQE
eukprot:gnl/MRDRNA2_/MRDRNA2_33092_c0_seq1.p1 gnl/MRDRNA2_/MRDRNA2_33092_c0~~gnl/MRDRNA2_/MRDRNA2_33092_c0_seq1.p1  ORF type:complete len:1199 (-),score=224.83 gnl/MRDRNA2_/MRDRNA2_33092_c0_seq1:270-3638(-)